MSLGRISLTLAFAVGVALSPAQPETAATVIAEISQPASDPDLGTDILAALAVDGQLWLVGDSRESKRNGNALVSFSLADGTRTLRFLDRVAKIAKIDGKLWVLRSTPTSEISFQLLQWNGAEFTSTYELELRKDERILALVGVAGAPAIVSTFAVRTLGGGIPKTIKLHPKFDDGFGFGVATVGTGLSGKLIYIGLDRGEWGGGMLSIDPESGALNQISSDQKSDGGFGTVLDSSLDPVNSIIADPENSDCVIAAVGLVHFMSSGRILRVCKDKVSVVFEHLVPDEVNGHKFNTSDAFFGLIPATDGYWAVGTGGIYHFRKTGNPEHIANPELRLWHGLWLTRDVAGVIVLSTDMNRTFSVSGYTPMIVALDGQ